MKMTDQIGEISEISENSISPQRCPRPASMQRMRADGCARGDMGISLTSLIALTEPTRPILRRQTWFQRSVERVSLRSFFSLRLKVHTGSR